MTLPEPKTQWQYARKALSSLAPAVIYLRLLLDEDTQAKLLVMLLKLAGHDLENVRLKFFQNY